MAYVRAIYDRSTPPTEPRGKPVGYEVRYRDGLNRQRTKGGFRRKRDAEAFAHEVETAKQRGTLVNPQDANVLFGSVADAWLSSVQGRRRPRTVKGYEHLLDRYVRAAFGQRRVAAITFAEVDGFVRSLEARGPRAGTVRNNFYVLKMVLDYAIRDGRIRSNPCTSVELPSAASPEMLFLTVGEVRTLSAEVERRCLERSRRPDREALAATYGLLVEFAAFTGLRAGEIAALHTGAVDHRAGTVHVDRSVADIGGARVELAPKTKAGRRKVVVPAFLADQLRSHLGDRALDRDGLVFALPDGTPVKYGTFCSEYFRPAVRAALEPRLWSLRFHDLRHTYASFLVEQGAHPKEMADLMGHSSVQITLDRYSHVMPHMRSALAQRLDEAYRSTPAAPSHGGSVTKIT